MFWELVPELGAPVTEETGFEGSWPPPVPVNTVWEFVKLENPSLVVVIRLDDRPPQAERVTPMPAVMTKFQNLFEA